MLRQHATVLEEEACRLLQHRGHRHGDNHAEHSERVVADDHRSEQERRVEAVGDEDATTVTRWGELDLVVVRSHLDAVVAGTQMPVRRSLAVGGDDDDN